jgi:hypothetical protein
MKGENLFQIEINELNRHNTVERKLRNLLDKYLYLPKPLEASKSATKELIEHYLAAVRSRNKIRRNWHGGKALECDITTLKWVSKKECNELVSNQLIRALRVTTNGDKVIEERAIKELTDAIVENIYRSKRKGAQPTELEDIVKKILKGNPDATGTEVINEMKANPSAYNIIQINDIDVVIRVPIGTGKQYIDKTRSLKTVRNVMTRLKPPKKSRK